MAIADMADDVLRLMDVLAVPKAVLIGHSLGSFVVRKAFELAPHRVSRLVLIGGALKVDNDVVRELQRAVNELTDPVDEAFVRDFQMSTIAMPVPAPFLEAVIANSRRMPARIWKAVIQGLIEFEPAAVRPDVRALVLGGREDAVFSRTEQIVLARQFPRGELQLLDGVGHYAPLGAAGDVREGAGAFRCLINVAMATTTAAAVARALAERGIDRAFGLPGGEVLVLIDELRKAGIDFVLMRHEANAGLAAAVYGKLKGQPGVVIATLGPGAANLLLPVANAYLDQEPLLAITAQLPDDVPPEPHPPVAPPARHLPADVQGGREDHVRERRRHHPAARSIRAWSVHTACRT